MNKENNKYGMGFLKWLTILFIGLKLCNVITWSWIFVISPLLITIGLDLLLIVLEKVNELLENKLKQLEGSSNEQ